MSAKLYIKPELKDIDKIAMGRRIRSQREHLEMTREDLAFATDISPKFIMEIEYGEKGVSLNNFYKISQALDVSCDYLISGAYENEELDARVCRIAENIIEPLKDCTPKELEFMEKMAVSYKALLKETKK